MTHRLDAIGVVTGWLARAGLLALWAAVGWGTLLLVATAAGAWREGPWAALSRLLPAPDGGPWAWVNALTAVLAALVWLLAAGLLAAAARRHRSRSGVGTEATPGTAAREQPSGRLCAARREPDARSPDP